MFIKPILPAYDPAAWAKLPFAERSRLVCEAWGLQGYGSPIAVYLAYALKIAGYIAGWFFFCGFSPGMGHVANVETWWLEPVAFQKAIVWSMLFELLGLGCGSGPLTARYLPPVGGFLYFLRPGTTKLPVLRGAPLVGGHRRNLIDVLAYATTLGVAIHALVSPRVGIHDIFHLAVLLVVLGLLDKTLFLAARGEHYWTTLLVFFLAGDAATEAFVPGAKAVHAALWFWAGFSKLNHHFPAVVGVMTSNNPFLRLGAVRRRMYRSYPDDLSPSKIAVIAGHAGTGLELAVPVILLTSHGGVQTYLGLALMLGLHGFITSNVPMGVPLEWNVIMVYGGFYLFWKNAAVGVLAMSPAVAVVVLVMCVALPILGNLFPARIPFLLAMRYYAGNWPYNVWLFRGDAYRKLEKLTKSSGWVIDQLERLYGRSTAIALLGKTMGWRLMHLHGRVLGRLVPRLVDDLGAHEWVDGELVAGMVLGWNFGDGHLSREDLLEAVQAQCHFAPGELRVVMVESQPLGGASLHWRLHDAATGLIEEGQANVNELRARQPWDVD